MMFIRRKPFVTDLTRSPPIRQEWRMWTKHLLLRRLDICVSGVDIRTVGTLRMRSA